MKILLTLVVFLTISVTAFAQKKETPVDTIDVKLSAWEVQQLKNFEKIEQRKADLQKEGEFYKKALEAAQREFDLLTDKQNTTWDAIYNAHKEVDRQNVGNVKFIQEQNILRLKMKKIE